MWRRKFFSPPRSAAVWCQRWKTGVAITYLNGPSVQSRLACTKAECAMVIGPSTTKTFGEMPASNKTTSATTLPKNRLTGWKRAAEIHSSSSEEWCTA